MLEYILPEYMVPKYTLQEYIVSFLCNINREIQKNKHIFHIDADTARTIQRINQSLSV